MLPKDCFNTKIQIDGLKGLISKAKLQGNKVAEASFQTQLDGLVQQYNSVGCGVDIIMDRCLYITNRVSFLETEIAYYTQKILQDNRVEGKLNQYNAELTNLKKEALGLNCIAKVEQSRQKIVSGIVNTFSEIDKARIETQSKAEANKRVIIGAAILIGAVVLIILFAPKK